MRDELPGSVSPRVSSEQAGLRPVGARRSPEPVPSSSLRLPLSQPHPGTAAVFVDELDAGRFKGAPNDVKRRVTRLTYPSFQLVHSHDAHFRAPREFLLVPTKQSAGCSALSWCDHKAKVPRMNDSHNSIKILLTCGNNRYFIIAVFLHGGVDGHYASELR